VGRHTPENRSEPNGIVWRKDVKLHVCAGLILAVISGVAAQALGVGAASIGFATSLYGCHWYHTDDCMNG
jgi:hypothetical protein